MLKPKVAAGLLLVPWVIFLMLNFFGILPQEQGTTSEEKELEEEEGFLEGAELQAALERAPAYLEDIVFLELLLENSCKEASEELKRLAEEKNAVGYMANLALAERYSNLEESPDYYYQRALELYDTSKVRLQLAAWLAETGEKEKAIEQYLLLVPNWEAMYQLTRMEADIIRVSRSLVEGNHWQEAVRYIEDVLSDVDNDNNNDNDNDNDNIGRGSKFY